MELSAHELNVDDGELDDEGDDDDENYEDNQLYCGTCERHFSNSYSFKKHVSEHRTCGIDECSFTAHEKIIEKHIIMQHTTGLYDKIRNVSTPEDIAKWIADRKRNYPTKDNVEKRYKKQEEMLKRGEKIQKNKDRFGRKNAFRLQKQQGPKKNIVRKRKSNFRKKGKTQSLIDERCNWNGNLCPFRGTKELYSTPEKYEDSEFDDDEWIEDDTKSKPVAPKLRLNNALGALMGAYNSSGESDLESQGNTCDIKKSNSDDEAPVEEKILRLPAQLNVENKNSLDLGNQNDHCATKNKRKRTRHRVWGKNKKPRNDNQRPVKEQQVVTSTENKKVSVPSRASLKREGRLCWRNCWKAK